MKKLATSLFFGKDARLSGLIAFAIVGAIALGCTCSKEFGTTSNSSTSNSSTTGNSTTTTTETDTDSNGIPSDPTLQALVKETTADFAQALDTNDFSEIYENASSDFKSTYTEDQMADVFKEFVQKKKLILPSLNKVPAASADFSPAPSIRQEKGLDILVLEGKFPTKPLNVKFEYEYVRRDGEWKLLKLVVNM
ncbi:MAG: hypothetical protein IT174_15225 [Acidobacteria bacterium]|nr:hypothetical protein [Acidobacteriota bacterium]